MNLAQLTQSVAQTLTLCARRFTIEADHTGGTDYGSYHQRCRSGSGGLAFTVSRTCKDSPSISRETKERVRRIMAQLGYEPNVEAEPVEAFSKTIGIILPSSQRDVYENAFHLEIIRGIGQFCNQRRYVNTVITGQDDAEVLDASRAWSPTHRPMDSSCSIPKRTARWRRICAAKAAPCHCGQGGAVGQPDHLHRQRQRPCGRGSRRLPL